MGSHLYLPPLHRRDLRCSGHELPAPAHSRPRCQLVFVPSASPTAADSCLSLTKSRSPHRPAPAHTAPEPSSAPPRQAPSTDRHSAETRPPPHVPGDPEPRFGSVRHHRGKAGAGAGGGTSAEAFPGQGGGFCWVLTPRDKPQDTNAPPFGRWGRVRRCCVQASASAGVQKILPVGRAPLSEPLVDPLWVRRVNVARARVNTGQ